MYAQARLSPRLRTSSPADRTLADCRILLLYYCSYVFICLLLFNRLCFGRLQILRHPSSD